MKKSVVLTMGAIVLASTLGACVPSQTSNKETTESVAQSQKAGKEVAKKDNLPTIAVVQLMEHTSLNIIYKAIMQTLKGENPDVVVPITTPVAQGAMELAATTPVVFTAVTDPVAAGVVTDFNITDKGMTGTSDIIQVDKILDLALEITPDIKNIGYIYNSGEDNSVSNLEKVEAYAGAHNLTISTTAITSSSELQSAATTMVEKVDAIFVANDNTVAEAMPILMSVANAAKVPVYVGADSMVMDGGFATVGIDYNNLGKETANMVDEVLKGKKTSEIPVKVFKDDLNIYINTDTAAALGIKIPENILSSEKFVEIKNK